MDAVEIEIDEDGRIRGPRGVKLRVQAERVEYPLPPADREERLNALWASINADRNEIVLKPWPEKDPIVEKYRRKALIE